MTETTEEKVKRIVMNQEGLKILDMIKGDFHDCIAELAGHGVSTTTIATLVNAHTSLTEEIQVTKAQVTSITKERDELKSKIGSNEYYCAKCSDCNWEGSSKFLRVSQFDECDISCPCCHSNNLDDSNKALNDDQSISNIRDYIDMQAFSLSKAEEENKELKQNIRNFINEGEGYCPDCLDRALKDPEIDNDVLRAQKSALEIHRCIKKRQDKEIKELKETITSIISQTELEVDEPNTFCENCEPWVGAALYALVEIEHLALAYLKKDEGEEE